jgi:hypothetical protein
MAFSGTGAVVARTRQASGGFRSGPPFAPLVRDDNAASLKGSSARLLATAELRRRCSLRTRITAKERKRFYAKRMNARTTELEASHLAFISRPKEVSRIILEAAATAGK